MNTTPQDSPPSITSLIQAEPGWVATVYEYERDDEGRMTVIGTERHRVLGWALVERDGTAGFEAVYVEAPGMPTCASLHNSYAPDLAQVYAHFEPEATDLNDLRLDRQSSAITPSRNAPKETAVTRDQIAQEAAEHIAGLIPKSEERHAHPDVTVHYLDDTRPPTDVPGIKAALLEGRYWISWMDDHLTAAMEALAATSV